MISTFTLIFHIKLHRKWEIVIHKCTKLEGERVSGNSLHFSDYAYSWKLEQTSNHICSGIVFQKKTLEKESSIDRCIKVEIDHSNFHEIPVDL